MTASIAPVEPANPTTPRPLDVTAIRRPHPNLLTYYLLSALRWGPLYPIGLLRNLFRYRTLRYQFDDEGVHMSWGVVFHRAISLTYARLQDIHLESNVVERWLGLARVQLQTAAGSATAEMTLEGIQRVEELRDFLYSRMRGARGARSTVSTPQPPEPGLAEAIRALEATREELRGIRQSLEATSPPGPVSARGKRP